MEHYWNLFNDNSGLGCSDAGRGESGDGGTSINAWESVDPAARKVETAGAFEMAVLHHGDSHYHRDERHHHHQQQQQRRAHCSASLYLGNGSHYYNPDPHLMCLKLGKRHYFEDMVNPAAAMGVVVRQAAVSGPVTVKECKLYSPSWVVKQLEEEAPPPVGVAAATPAVVSQCQVEGCEAVLVNAKDYHRRHKVCEMHAKAPRVVVLGVEQRFCQQCSRFHKVGEFDESKRSCRRRLAGHNERRRKSSQDHSHSKKSALGRDTKTMAASRCAPCFPSSSECALSLLSSQNSDNGRGWNSTSLTSPAHFPARCSAALRELIAENRASISLACSKQVEYTTDRMERFCNSESNGSNQRLLDSRGNLTLDLMQASQILSLHQDGGTTSNHNQYKSTKDGNGSDFMWKLPLGY